MKLDAVPIWVQVYALPHFFITESIGRTLGNRLGDVLEVDVEANGRRSGGLFRIRVALPVDKPLQCKLPAKPKGKSEIVKYELK